MHYQKYSFSDVEKIFGVGVQKPTINAIIIATKEVVFGRGNV